MQQGSFHEIEIKPKAFHDYSNSKDNERTTDHKGIAGISAADGNSGYPLEEEKMEGKQQRKKKSSKFRQDNLENEDMDRMDDGTKPKKRKKKMKMMHGATE